MSATTVLDASNLTFGHERGSPPQVDGVSLRLRAGRTFGVLGANECGKTTLAHILLGHLRAQAGVATVLGVRADGPARTPRWLIASRALLLACCAVATLLAVSWPARLVAAVDAGGWLPALFALVLEVAHDVQTLATAGSVFGPSTDAARETGTAPAALRARGVGYVSSEHNGGQKLPADATIEAVIGEHMPLPKGARRAEVLAALRASGFQMYTDSGTPVGGPEEYLAQGLKVSQLSGGQKHLVYVLSVLAARPALLIADEMLCGLDIDRQSSMLGLLQKLQLGFGMAILFLTVDEAAFSLMAHDGAFMHKGRFVEAGPAHELLEAPSRPETRHYLQISRENEERSRGKNLRQAYQKGESVFNL